MKFHCPPQKVVTTWVTVTGSLPTSTVTSTVEAIPSGVFPPGPPPPFYNATTATSAISSSAPAVSSSSAFSLSSAFSVSSASSASSASSFLSTPVEVSTPNSAPSSTPVANPDGRAVYAHYMVSGIDSTTDHAQRDIDDALAMGFDGFALNTKEPNEWWATEAIDQLFAAAEGTGFKLFFSLDMNGHSDNSIFTSLFDGYFDQEAYLKVGDEQKPFVSTFWGGQLGQEAWSGMVNDYNLHFVPSFDDLDGYYEDPASFFEKWGDIVDGAFNWETAWPGGSGKPANVSSDDDADWHDAATDVQKDFMMPISPLQYKHCCGTNAYRVGEGNLPERMTQILDIGPKLVQFMTWNDGGESHYIGNLWDEAFESSPEIVAYANNDEFSHKAWQPLLSSFITAYKSGVDASQMTPPGDSPVGAIWYRPVLKSCTSDIPDNADAALDAVSYGFVLPASLEGAIIRVTSGGTVLSEIDAVAGLNYGTIGDMLTGEQKVEIVQDGSVVASAGSLAQVQADMDGFCNFNYYVVGLESN